MCMDICTPSLNDTHQRETHVTRDLVYNFSVLKSVPSAPLSGSGSCYTRAGVQLSASNVVPSAPRTGPGSD